MWKHLKWLVCGAAIFAAVSAAFAADKLVGQRDRRFSTNLITVHRDEALWFFNDDTVPHNVMSSNSNNGFDLGSQLPGIAIPVSFSEIGLVAVICAIHPRMHMTIHVVD